MTKENFANIVVTVFGIVLALGMIFSLGGMIWSIFMVAGWVGLLVVTVAIALIILLVWAVDNCGY